MNKQTALLKGWLIEVIEEGESLTISLDGTPGQIHIKAEDEGFVVDIWNDHDEPLVVASTYAHYHELDRE